MVMDGSTVILLVVVLSSILVSITLHEAMHAFTSHWLGDDTAYRAGRLTLNPLAHIDPFTTVLLPILLVLSGLPPFGAAKPVPFNPYLVKGGEYGAALVGVAGPLTNLVLAFISGLWARFLFDLEGAVAEVLVVFMFVNIGFFIFNMIPYPPLDGSRLLYAFAPEPLQEIMRSIEQTGFMGIIFFMLFLYAFIAPLIGDAIFTVADFILGTNNLVF